MRKTAAALALIFIFTINPVSAGVVGHVYSTDIKVFIDHLLVPSYNVDGSSVVLIRDLEHFGYTVFWDEESRTVVFYRDFSNPPEPILPLYSALPSGTLLFDVYESNIKTIFNGREIPAFNIDGRMAVKVRDLSQVGEPSWDAERARAGILSSDAEYFEDEINYIEEIFYGHLLFLSRGDYIQRRILSALEWSRADKALTDEFSEYRGLLKERILEFKEYIEPYGFSKSAMEIYWAMINDDIACAALADILKGEGGEEKTLWEEYNQAQKDSLVQRQISLIILAEDMMGVTMYWD